MYIKKIDGPDSFALRNGMLGPATTALHALIDAFTTGAISGQRHSSYTDTTVPGTIVGSMLADIDELDPTFHREGDWARFVAFRDALEDDAEYAVQAIEVQAARRAPTGRAGHAPAWPCPLAGRGRLPQHAR